VGDEPAPPEGPRIEQSRVYYHPGSGEVVHVHQLVHAAGEELDRDRVEDEMKAFEDAVRQRHGDVDYLVVQPEDLLTSGEPITVDVAQHKLLRGQSPG
jgi:hypothetical protein